MSHGDHPVWHRPWIRWILISGLIWFAVRVGSVASREGDLPSQSANDRSRWATIRALVEHGTYEIDRVIAEKRWNTIDKVAHPNRAGERRFYSSKPPLLPTLIAGLYALLIQGTSLLAIPMTMESHPLLIGRLIVFLVNGAMLWVLWRTMEQVCQLVATSSWSMVMAMFLLVWGTHLSNFAITLNNHLPAAMGTALTLRSLLRVDRAEGAQPWDYVVGGFGAAFAFANEFPALLLLVLSGGMLWWRSPRYTLSRFLPVAALVVVAQLGTNWLAHDTVIPAYAHRKAGGDWATGNWYVYPGSYWLPENRQGVDRGEPSRWVYLFHTVVGHHGVFLLNPAWLLCILAWPRRGEGRAIWRVGWASLAMIFATWGFYVLARSQIDRNYAGVCVTFRWLLWLIPCGVVLVLPVLDRASARPSQRRVIYLLWGLAAISAAYGWFRPWQSPWAYALWLAMTPT